MVSAPRYLNEPDKRDDSDQMALSRHHAVSHGIN